MQYRARFADSGRVRAEEMTMVCGYTAVYVRS